MVNLYTKNAEKLYINSTPNANGKYAMAGEGIPSYQKKLGVENPLEIENRIVKLKLDEITYTSGAIQYGAVVKVDAVTNLGYEIPMVIDASQCFNYIKKFGVINSEILGEFVILFKGVTSEIQEKDSTEHVAHIKSYFDEIEKEQKLKEKSKKIIYEVDKSYKIDGKTLVYFGEYFTCKPKVKKEFYKYNYDPTYITVTKPNKYHIFIKSNDIGFSEILFLTNSALAKKEIKVLHEIESVNKETLNKFYDLLENYNPQDLNKYYRKYSNTSMYNRTKELRMQVKNAQIEYLINNLSLTKEQVKSHELEDLKNFALLALNNPVIW